MKITIEIRGVSKVFNTERGHHVALKDVDLDIRQGEFVSFIGHSGCGKSTLLNLVAGLTDISSGTIAINGEAVKGPGLDRAMVFQNYSLLPWLSVRQNIREAVDAAQPKLSEDEKSAIVDQFIGAVKLGAHADKKPAQLSGGMKQRVAIARAFAVHPKILILDEPFGALDALTKGALHDTLSALWQSENSQVETVLMVTHDIDEAIYLSDRIVVLSNGPAAKISEIFEVNLPRPRDKRAMTTSRETIALKTRLLEKLHAGHAMSSGGGRDTQRIRIGFVPLLDCALLVMAQELGFFRKAGLRVELRKQPSWAAVRDKTLSGELQMSHCLFSLPLSVATGITEPRGAHLKIAMNLASNGQAIVLSRAFEGVAAHDARALKTRIEAIISEGRRPVFAMTYAGGTHDIWLRLSLLAAGIDLKAIAFVTLPPPQMVMSLEHGEIDGFSAGEPWPALAVEKGVGAYYARSGELWPDHPEKVLAVNETFARERSDDLKRVIRAVLEAAQWLERADNRAQTAQVLAGRSYLDKDAALLEDLLKTGQFKFCDYGALNLPQRAHAQWFLEAFVRCGLLEKTPESKVVDAVIMQAPYRDVARGLGWNVPNALNENAARSLAQSFGGAFSAETFADALHQGEKEKTSEKVEVVAG